MRRVDTDAVRKKKILRELLADFGRGKIDILLGTQMVAKGLNFPGVKLVGIVSADTGLQLPDFRAAERTFNLIVQVSGRAGRRIPDGKVVIQTFKPQNEVIRMAAEGRLEDFYTKEIEVRQELNFPPFSRLIRLVFRGRDSNKTRNAASAFLSQIPESSLDRVSLLGPAECPLAMISGTLLYTEHKGNIQTA
ncbi:Primosomal protein N' [subsurface metagenome]